MKDTKISVAIATYNGELYLKEQIDSILLNLSENDEIVISDDGSSDNTLKILKNYNDSRIKIYNGPKKGVKKNFENAISKCSGDYIFLADQDDIWEKDKVKEIKKYLGNYDLVIHDARIFENEAIIYDSFFIYRGSKKGTIKNIIKNSYVGCCMAFKKEMVDKILPIPNNIEMHDQWIGLMIEKYGKVFFLDKQLIKYRRHENNVSDLKHHKFSKMLTNRICLIKEYVRR